MSEQTPDPGTDATPAPAPETKAPQQEVNKPEDVLRDGNIKATIWKNERENGPSYNTTFARTWQDEDGAFHDSQSFSGTELLRVSELARGAYARTNELRHEHRQEREQTAAHDDELPYDERSDLAAFKAKREVQTQEARSKPVTRRK